MNEWLDRPREWVRHHDFSHGKLSRRGPFCVSTAADGTSSLGRRRCFFPFHHHPPSHTSFSYPSPTCSSFPLTFGSAPYTLIPRPSLICKGQLAIAEKLTIDHPPPSWPFSFSCDSDLLSHSHPPPIKGNTAGSFVAPCFFLFVSSTLPFLRLFCLSSCSCKVVARLRHKTIHLYCLCLISSPSPPLPNQ
ncbi:hypothetical protein CMEL01_06297 [Colletotrichum melonis]|uniref:Uncharacterized protein n=1 Tax=Colletotrichum melonis TaxID=1209925 RepID=A0AAI9U4V1_9PEZI|nr:hypothetical protein CMEL01_06297 [Colletotrichum melonis]